VLTTRPQELDRDGELGGRNHVGQESTGARGAHVLVHAERVRRHGEGADDQVGGAGCGTAGPGGLGHLGLGDGDGNEGGNGDGGGKELHFFFWGGRVFEEFWFGREEELAVESGSDKELEKHGGGYGLINSE